ncbi:two-component system sensor histidine kinase YesM [Paenibacillus endophyticus]|uniref:histidine kinase n=1 Tax=Paenibacillus endophyticus TaxID=1294268 RepID=A0A7W5C7V6_9BACL|nr:histidine kinase [Paenibacillus endophyticus]MBB3152765.1 two-component system sensor histidine kinase YesM [Paenibacillus endophyticus]
MTNRALRAIRETAERVTRRLVNKLILLFTTIIILVVASLTFISYQMFQKESVTNSIASTSNNLLLVNQNMEDYLKGMEQLSLPQIRFDEITYAIMHESEDYASKMYLENYLRQLYYSRNDLQAIYLYVVNENKYYSITKENYNIAVRTGTDPKITETTWYGKAMTSPFNRSYQSFVTSESEAVGYPIKFGNTFMAYHRVLRSIVSRQPQAVLSFYFDNSVSEQILKDIPFDEGQHLLFLSPDNEPFYTDDEAFYKRAKEASLTEKLTEGVKGRLTWSEGSQKYLVVYNIGEQEGWRLVKPIPYSQIYEAARTTRNLGFIIGLLFLLLSIIIVIYFSNAITRPLQKLSYHMSRFGTGDFDAEAEVKGRDEIAYLSRHFNLMVRRTNDLINERYKMKLVEKNAILKALEAEINPHFLYNALQAISTKALKNERYDIADMVDALALTLRYCISGKDIVQARDELKHIENYLSLQKARFGSRLQVAYEWQEALLGLELPKLSIQTLVENAIKHALEKVSSTITIEIRAAVTETHAVISVRDNGPGFTPERLEQVRQSFLQAWEDREDENESIGLVNLNTRLKLLYGDGAELIIHTDKSSTELAMLLPRGGVSHV